MKPPAHPDAGQAPAASSRWLMHTRRRSFEAIVTLVLALLFFAFVGADAFRQDLALLAVAYALLALGMYIPLILGGELSLAYNAYFAIGAYSVAIVANATGLPLLLAVPIAVVISMLTATILAVVTRNLSGFHLAVATLMFGIAAQHWLVHADKLTGGAGGLGNIPRLSLFGWPLERAALIGLGILVVWLFAMAASRLRTSMIGISLRAQREAASSAEACGVPIVTLKVFALATGAGIASLAGVLFALMNRFVLPESFTVAVVFLVLFMPILGGAGTPWGSVLGALIVVALTLGFDFFQGPGSLTFGVLTLLILLAAPAGILGWLKDGLAYLARRGTRKGAGEP